MGDYTVYIDESGDLGINRGTQWFVLSAVVVEKSEEKNIREKINQIKTRLNVKEIHMKKINDFYRRAYITRELGLESFTYMNILVDTRKFDKNKIPNSLIAYNYVCKYLLQRVSWFLREKNKTADIVLSARGTSRDGELIQYIQEKLMPYKNNNIDASLFDKVSAKTAATWDLLQLADVCATTMFLAYELNGYGFCVPCYAMNLHNHLYKKNNIANSYGIKFFNDDMKPDIENLREKRICGKQ